VTARLLDGRAVAKDIVREVRDQVAELEQAGLVRPLVAVVRVGDDAASIRYAGQIQRAFAGAGLGFQLVDLSSTIDDLELRRRLELLNSDHTVGGILLLFPLPRNLNPERAVEAIDPAKDIDGVTPLNAGRLFSNGGRHFVPATPLGGLELLRRAEIPLAGAHAVVVGRSEIVGKPLAVLLLRRHATVTICHSRTIDLARFTRQADILAVAAGRPGLITGDMVAPGAVVLDFGMNLVSGALVGDVDAASVGEIAGAITPVPGGTGPMTNAMLLVNTLQAAKWQAGYQTGYQTWP
jgi:methylenetetrahydrofolate dehydrogenase (NADP+)/methenyltetrahydrofolate cyclohydrolase